MRVFSDPYFPVCGQNLRFCGNAGKQSQRKPVFCHSLGSEMLLFYKIFKDIFMATCNRNGICALSKSTHSVPAMKGRFCSKITDIQKEKEK